MEAPGSHAASEEFDGKAREQAGFEVRRLLVWHIFEQRVVHRTHKLLENSQHCMHKLSQRFTALYTSAFRENN